LKLVFSKEFYDKNNNNNKAVGGKAALNILNESAINAFSQ